MFRPFLSTPKSFSTPVAIALALALPTPAPAQEEPSEDQVMLPMMEVSATAPALESAASAPKTEVTAEALDTINAPEISDAIKYQPNLLVRKRYIGDRNAPLAVRDMHTTQTARALVMGDGLLLSNFLGSSWNFAPRWSVMQPEEIDRIEVLYGPYAAEYSGNTLGGAVIMHSRMPESFQTQANAGLFLQDFDAYGTDDTYFGHKLHASVGDRQGRFSYFLAADQLSNEGHPMSFGVTSASGGAPGSNPVTGAYGYSGGGYVYNSPGTSELSEHQVKLKLGYDLSEQLQARVTLAYLQREEDNLNPESYLRNAAGEPVYNGPADIDGRSYNVSSQRLGESSAQDLIYGAELEGEVGGGWELKTSLSFYDILEQESRSSNTNYAQAQANGPGTLTRDEGSGWQAFDLKLGHRHEGGWLGERVLFGYHYDQYELSQTSFNTSNWRDDRISDLTGDSRGQTRVHAVFAENEWQLAEPWALVLGARQEWWQASEGSLARDFSGARVQADYPERSESRFSPKASLNYQPNADWQAALSLGVAYRFPTVGELYQGSIDNAGNFVAGFDPDLKTEKGFAKNLRLTRLIEAHSVTVNLWENDVDNSIYRQTNLQGVTSYQNIDRVLSRGLELVTALRDLGAEGLELDFNVAYTRAEIRENAGVPASVGKQFPRVPYWRANLAASYPLTEQLRVGGGVRYASDPYDSLDNSDGDLHGFGYTDRFVVVDARASYELGRGFSLAGGIDNLTDERYYVYHPYPGRTFYAEIKWNAL